LRQRGELGVLIKDEVFAKIKSTWRAEQCA
jgi:hypothetical protein